MAKVRMTRRELVERIVPDGLAAQLTRRRERGDSWDRIARDFEIEYHIDVSPRVVRQWAHQVGVEDDDPEEVPA